MGTAGNPPLPSGNGAHLLLVDDEPHITELLASTLRFAGYRVTVAATGAAAQRAAAGDQVALAILDVVLPDLDGFTVCRRLRVAQPLLPVLFLSARDSVTDKITGLTLGGDDYITKPFSVAEVIARVHAVLRRADGASSTDRVLRHADLEIDDARHEVRRGGQFIELSPTEYRLLRHLVLNAGCVLSKRQLLDHVWQYDFGGDANVVEKFVSNLRRKIDATGPPLIRTVRGFGYALRQSP
jgi:two-component system OmpR family response regulator